MEDKYFQAVDIINSLRFYLMLSITCKQNAYFMGDPEAQLNSYLKILKDELHYNADKIKSFVKSASDSMPSAFVQYYGFETVNKR